MVLELHISYGTIILSSIIGILLGFVLELVFFSVDYSRTERVQFEDDRILLLCKGCSKGCCCNPGEDSKAYYWSIQQEKEDKDDGRAGGTGNGVGRSETKNR